MHLLVELCIVFASLIAADGQNSKFQKDNEIAACVFDVMQGATFISHVGTLLDGAEMACKATVEGASTRGCTAALSGIVAGFGNADAYLSAALSNCGTDWPRFPALCSADSAAVIAAASMLIDGIDSVVLHCTGGDRENKGNATNTKLATCAVDNLQGTLFIRRVVQAMESFQTACSPGVNWKTNCASAAVGLSAAFGNVAIFFSASVSNCAWQNPPDVSNAKCGAAISEIVKGVSYVTDNGLGMVHSCSTVKLNDAFAANRAAENSEEQEARLKMEDDINAQLKQLASKAGTKKSGDVVV